MALFDYYMMVDWSGGKARRGNRTHCIWTAFGNSDREQPVCESPYSRSEAISRVRHLVSEVVRTKRRALVCFDFAFGYPRGFAAHLPRKILAAAPWQIVWDYLADVVSDDLGTNPGRLPSNRSNRLEVANMVNGLCGGQGPFWCVEPVWRRRQAAAGLVITVPQDMPKQPFVSRQGLEIPANRIADETVQSDYVFRLFGQGSVGSQVLTGIPALQRLRNSPELKTVSAVWPFETGWSPADDKGWLSAIHVLFAEIYPSVRTPLPDTITDRGQVRAMWHWARDLDQANALVVRFTRPQSLAEADEQAARTEEGWILH